MESPQEQSPDRADPEKQYGAQPLYEFSADDEQQHGARSIATQQEPVSNLSEPASGLVYPPPPSYYQNMQLPAERPPLPEPRQQTPSSAAGSPRTMPPHNSWQPGYPGYPPFAPHPGAPPYPHPYQPPLPPGQYPPPGGAPRPKQSRRTVWIVVSVISVIILFSCALGSWNIYTFFSSAFQQVNGMTQVVDGFYQHLQQQAYTAAYADLQINGLTADAFVIDAKGMDALNGVVRSYTSGIPALSTTAGDGSQWLITVNVTRANKAYVVPMTVENIDGAWKIIDFDVNRF